MTFCRDSYLECFCDLRNPSHGFHQECLPGFLLEFRFDFISDFFFLGRASLIFSKSFSQDLSIPLCFFSSIFRNFSHIFEGFVSEFFQGFFFQRFVQVSYRSPFRIACRSLPLNLFLMSSFHSFRNKSSGRVSFRISVKDSKFLPRFLLKDFRICSQFLPRF